ncbi:MarR family winged helix-turn-helix transcriptional regulator [Curtobacterium sp. MCLR17_036]|uniref:MarR family winged helix-turn-helix transcriptional regulator n=1 Tax=Curtobacterium sp. MCLR17_036 TaxID=2175620 RepID=UPI000DA95FF4|nr:MarR family winged helix-turn-helix transcriptional regulator [Curtobacterium sp. MCLR17_036]WIE64057.1 MarR family winged helix-turn-helix transcriptional regulator [Curtobacterium sp. MCLR17_036]
MAAPWSAQELETWAAVATLLERLPAALDAQLQRDSGLTHFEYGVLYALDVAPDRRLRMSVLAGYASCTLSRLSRAVTRLEAKRWTTRATDPDDGRYTLALLTPAGHDVVARATPAHRALVDRVVFDALGPARAQALGEIARHVSADLGPEAWTPPTPSP